MAQWQLTFDFSGFWKKYPDELSTKEVCEKVVSVLNFEKNNVHKLFPDYEYDLDDIISKFDDLSKEDNPDIDDFDHILEELYDWADEPLDNKWNGKKLAWIKTSF